MVQDSGGVPLSVKGVVIGMNAKSMDVVWDVPWTKRLYRVAREQETVKLVYTGHDHLTGRPYYPALTWSNESVFDHIGEWKA